jgi:hypothetical protein
MSGIEPRSTLFLITKAQLPEPKSSGIVLRAHWSNEIFEAMVAFSTHRVLRT